VFFNLPAVSRSGLLKQKRSYDSIETSKLLGLAVARVQACRGHGALHSVHASLLGDVAPFLGINIGLGRIAAHIVGLLPQDYVLLAKAAKPVSHVTLSSVANAVC
jgi:hypothetical protein